MKTFSDITVIVNTTAGSGLGGRVLPLAREQLSGLFPDARINVIETQSGLHATELGATIEADLLIVIGGDGTLHDVLQGLMTRVHGKCPALSLIAVGSGNDYARTIGVPADPSLALAALARAVPISVDIGHIESDVATTYFLETLSFGVDAAVAIRTMELRKTTQTKGLRLYARAAISAILKELKPFRAVYRVDEQVFESDLLICAVQNGPTYGSGFKIAPHASITDGFLNICRARRVGTLKAFYYLMRIKAGTHENLSAITTSEVKHFEITLDHQLPIQCDGEQLFGTHFTIELLPKTLVVLVPEDSPVLKANTCNA